MFHQQAAFYPDEDFEPVTKRTGYKNEFLVFSRKSIADVYANQILSLQNLRDLVNHISRID